MISGGRREKCVARAATAATASGDAEKNIGKVNPMYNRIFYYFMYELLVCNLQLKFRKQFCCIICICIVSLSELEFCKHVKLLGTAQW